VRFDLVVNILAQKAAAGQPLTVFGGEQWRPLLHVSDVSHAILHGLQRNITGLYNLHNENRKIYEIADEITRLIPGTRVIYNDIKFEDARNYRVTSDAYRNTGWLPQKTLEDGILEMYNVIKEKRIKDIHSSIYSNVEYIKENHIPD
jgi:nucleoside-diphosphate-sugar epimerase